MTHPAAMLASVNTIKAVAHISATGKTSQSSRREMSVGLKRWGWTAQLANSSIKCLLWTWHYLQSNAKIVLSAAECIPLKVAIHMRIREDIWRLQNTLEKCSIAQTGDYKAVAVILKDTFGPILWEYCGKPKEGDTHMCIYNWNFHRSINIKAHSSSSKYVTTV